MKEIVKMIMIAEWLKLKGITADDKWIRKHTKPKYKSSPITVATDHQSEELMEILGSLDCLKNINAKCTSLKQLLQKMIKEIESKDSFPSTSSPANQEIETGLMYCLSSVIHDVFGGWSIVKDCLSNGTHLQTSTNTLKNLTTEAEVQSPSFNLKADVDSIPPEANPGKKSVLTPGDNQSVEVNTTQTAGTKEIFAHDILDLPLASLLGKCTATVLPGVCVEFDKLSINVKSTVVHLNGVTKYVDAAQNEINQEYTTRIGVDDFDSLYADMNPNQFIALCVHVATKNSPGFIHGRVPNVCSWNELYSETVPWPQRWMSESSSIYTTTGGISIASIPAAVCIPAATAVGAALSHTIPTAVGTALRSIPAAVSTALHSIPAVVGTALNSIPVIGAALHVNKTSHSHPRPKQLRHSVHHTKKGGALNHGCQSSLSTVTDAVSSVNMPQAEIAIPENDDMKNEQNRAEETVQTNTAMLGSDDHQNRAEETVQTNTAMLGNDDHQNTAEETDQTNTAMLGNDDHQNTASEETDQTNTAMLGNDDHQNTAEETVQTNTAMLGNDDHQNTAKETDQTNTAMLGNDDHQNTAEEVVQINTAMLGSDDEDQRKNGREAYAQTNTPSA